MSYIHLIRLFGVKDYFRYYYYIDQFLISVTSGMSWQRFQCILLGIVFIWYCVPILVLETFVWRTPTYGRDGDRSTLWNPFDERYGVKRVDVLVSLSYKKCPDNTSNSLYYLSWITSQTIYHKLFMIHNNHTFHKSCYGLCRGS